MVYNKDYIKRFSSSDEGFYFIESMIHLGAGNNKIFFYQIDTTCNTLTCYAASFLDSTICYNQVVTAFETKVNLKVFIESYNNKYRNTRLYPSNETSFKRI